jgi:hypothetical protein
MDAISTASQGWTSAEDAFSQSAQRTASGVGDPAANAAAALQAEAAAEACAAVIETAQRMSGSLVDLLI